MQFYLSSDKVYTKGIHWHNGFSNLFFFTNTVEYLKCFCLVMDLLWFGLNHLDNFGCFSAFLAKLRQSCLLLSDKFCTPRALMAEEYDLQSSDSITCNAVFWIHSNLAMSTPVRTEFYTGAANSAMLLICLKQTSNKSE